LALPPAPMPSHDGLRPLKAWRYVGVYGPQVMLCAAVVRIGPARQSFWAVWDREHLQERTSFWRHQVELKRGRLEIAGRVSLRFEEEAGVECVCPADGSYAWTRKQGGIRAHGTVGDQHVEARAIIDDTAAYYPRHTSWRWSAGVGSDARGRDVAWNLVEGVNDPPTGSERTVWVDGQPREVGADAFDGLCFNAEATRERRDNLLLVRSRYRQPFGTFSGRLPDGIELAEGYGVMEEHDAWW
jgi:hypothetical protein